MVYKDFTFEEDTKKFREFLKSQLFRNASKTLTYLETDNGGLTAVEIWEEVDCLIDELRKTEPDDREPLVIQLYSMLQRKIRVITRNGQEIERPTSEIDRTVTCILYCLALRLEAACKIQENNPHNHLLDALVEIIIKKNHPILPLLHAGIKKDGDKYEEREGKELITESDPLEVSKKWKEQLRVVFNHYADRMSRYVERDFVDRFDALWENFINDEMVSQLMKEYVPIKGDECEKLHICYNAKALFNIYGLLFRQGFFRSIIRGETPLAKKVTEHYDSKTGNLTYAKYEYFKSDQANIKPQFNALDSDMYRHIMNIITHKK